MGEIWAVPMKGEGGERKLWDEGKYVLTIQDVRLVSKDESKSGNAYFLWTLTNEDNDKIEMITTTLEGKRWLLKQTLSACGIEASPNDPDEKYKFNPTMVVGKIVKVSIKNKENKFTGNDGTERTFTKSEIQRVDKADGAKSESEDVPF